MAAIGTIYQDGSATWSEMMRAIAEQADSDWRTGSLNQTAVRALRSTTGIHTVLVGMRQKKYVEDVGAELKRPVDVQKRTESWQTLAQEL
jgi:hypothetical protein